MQFKNNSSNKTPIELSINTQERICYTPCYLKVISHTQSWKAPTDVIELVTPVVQKIFTKDNFERIISVLSARSVMHISPKKNATSNLTLFRYAVEYLDTLTMKK